MLARQMETNATVVMMAWKEMVDWLLKRIVILHVMVTQLRRVVDFGDSQSMSFYHQRMVSRLNL